SYRVHSLPTRRSIYFCDVLRIRGGVLRQENGRRRPVRAGLLAALVGALLALAPASAQAYTATGPWGDIGAGYRNRAEAVYNPGYIQAVTFIRHIDGETTLAGTLGAKGRLFLHN